jgi:hypothetical protein
VDVPLILLRAPCRRMDVSHRAEFAQVLDHLRDNRHVMQNLDAR